MLLTLGLATLFFGLAGSQPEEPPLTVIEATLVEVRIHPLDKDQEEPPPSLRMAGLRFRDARWERTGERVPSRAIGGIEMTCIGLVDFESFLFERGDRVCLFAKASSSESWLCNSQRWYLAADSDCEAPVLRDRSMRCTAVSDECEETDDRPSHHTRSRPTRTGDTAVNATLQLDKLDAVGGYLQVGEVLVGRAPRAVAQGDVNGDGRPDFVVALAGELTVVVYLTNADDRPEAASMLQLERGACEMHVGEFSGDAFADVEVKFCATDGEGGDAWITLTGNGKGKGKGTFR